MERTVADQISSSNHQVFVGVPASPGVAFGPAFILVASPAGVETYPIKPQQVAAEIKRFFDAVELTKRDLAHARDEFAIKVDPQLAQIFDGHLALLNDPELIKKTEEGIRTQLQNAESILARVFDEQAKRIERLSEAKMASIASDVRDVCGRLMTHLIASGDHVPIRPTDSSIVISHDLAPSQTARMAENQVAGFATDVGGPVSHTALLAKALEIPAVVGLGRFADNISTGTPLIVDGFSGRVIANPTPEESRRYREMRREWKARGTVLSRLRTLPAETRDGYLVNIAANIELPSEIEHVLEHGADSIGLFRTEFLYLNNGSLPTEDEQYEVYRDVVEQMQSKHVIFRTLDLGGDKFISQIPLGQELNPFLGLRAIRLCLRYPQIFELQLRAILRASAHGKARIMLPMISGINQVREAKAIIMRVKDYLRKEGIAFDEEIEIGIMIEIPSAALTADILAKEVDFFSIGTNDLIQYTLAVDRVNEQVAHLYDPYHPSVLRLIREVINSAHRNGIWVGLCGEMASNPDLACLLVGLGIDELSMAASAIPAVKQRIRSVKLSALKSFTEDVYQLASSTDVRNLFSERVPRLVHGRTRATIKG